MKSGHGFFTISPFPIKASAVKKPFQLQVNDVHEPLQLFKATHLEFSNAVETSTCHVFRKLFSFFHTMAMSSHSRHTGASFHHKNGSLHLIETNSLAFVHYNDSVGAFDVFVFKKKSTENGKHMSSTELPKLMMNDLYILMLNRNKNIGSGSTICGTFVLSRCQVASIESWTLLGPTTEKG